MTTRIKDASTITGWRKSSYSGAQGDCVEVTHLANGEIALRDSKNPTGPALAITPSAWRAFLTAAADDEFTI